MEQLRWRVRLFINENTKILEVEVNPGISE